MPPEPVPSAGEPVDGDRSEGPGPQGEAAPVGSRPVPAPVAGRRYSVRRRVRLGDVSARGRLRLDATARYLQDVANDDASSADIEDAAGWVVRRTAIDVHRTCGFRDDLELTTWCSGLGARWAERRTVIVSSGGELVADAVAIWVHVDPSTSRPRRLGPRFEAVYGPSAAGRTVRARLEHPEPPGDVREVPWTLRVTDLDLMGHMNNAVYWEALEGELSRRRDLRAPLRASVEHRAGAEAGQDLTVVAADDDAGARVWFVADGAVAASCVVGPLPG
ncbi:MAG: thioesterase [Actinomycetota bacterium]|nr:thioesterase [Actinomycetota bacterium]